MQEYANNPLVSILHIVIIWIAYKIGKLSAAEKTEDLSRLKTRIEYLEIELRNICSK